MTQVTVHNTPATPSDEIISDANKEHTVIDSKGRTIGLKKPKFRSQFQLAKILGEDSSNEALRGMYYPLYFISSIDGVPNAFLNSRDDLDGLVDRLDSEGYTALGAGILKYFGDQINEQAAKDNLKK